MQFARRKDPGDCALLFVALGKKGQLHGLYKAVRNEKLTTFLANDFNEPRWRSAALKNAFALLSKQQHELAAARRQVGNETAPALGGHGTASARPASLKAYRARLSTPERSLGRPAAAAAAAAAAAPGAAGAAGAPGGAVPPVSARP